LETIQSYGMKKDHHKNKSEIMDEKSEQDEFGEELIRIAKDKTKKNGNKYIITSDVYHKIKHHVFYIRLCIIFISYLEIGFFHVRDVEKLFKLSYQRAFIILENLCKLDVLEKKCKPNFNIYHFKKDDKGNPIILNLIKSGLEMHRDCCIEKHFSNLEMFKKKNKTLDKFSKEEGGGNDK